MQRPDPFWPRLFRTAPLLVCGGALLATGAAHGQPRPPGRVLGSRAAAVRARTASAPVSERRLSTPSRTSPRTLAKGSRVDEMGKPTPQLSRAVEQAMQARQRAQEGGAARARADARLAQDERRVEQLVSVLKRAEGVLQSARRALIARDEQASSVAPNAASRSLWNPRRWGRMMNSLLPPFLRARWLEIETPATSPERQPAGPFTELLPLERKVAEVTVELRGARQQWQVAREQATRARSEAQALDATAQRADQLVEVLRTKLAAAERRRLPRRAERDQHVAHLSDAAARRLFRAARSRMRSAAFVVPKPDEISQDAVATAPEHGRFAIADGVTNSDFSGELARALVRRWVEAPPASREEFVPFLAKAQAEWHDETGPAIVRANRDAWYNRGKEWIGHAAFIGARLLPTRGGQRLEAMGTGDSVMLLARDAKLVRAWPLQRSAEFSNLVKALPSRGPAPFPVEQVSWAVKPGDEVFMLTDALGAWALGEVERGREPFSLLREIASKRAMADFVVKAREQGIAGREQMAVDDTSLVRFVVPPRATTHDSKTPSNNP